MVGTHVDDPDYSQQSMVYLTSQLRNNYCCRYPNIKTVLSCSTKTKRGIEELIRTIYAWATADDLPFMPEQVPRCICPGRDFARERYGSTITFLI